MKKQGFTLIELLAVIVIMGILMFAAIPAINRTIENARKDQFVDTAQNYARAVETLWYADGLECKNGDGTSYQKASALPKSTGYCVDIDTTGATATAVELLQQGGKSPWGNKDVKGHVRIFCYDEEECAFSPFLYDGTHAIGTDDGFDYRDTDEINRGSVYTGEDANDAFQAYGTCADTMIDYICRAI